VVVLVGLISSTFTEVISTWPRLATTVGWLYYTGDCKTRFDCVQCVVFATEICVQN